MLTRNENCPPQAPGGAPQLTYPSLWIAQLHQRTNENMTMTIALPQRHFMLLLLAVTLLLSCVTLVASKKEKNLQDLVYREFPRRTEAEAAVMEWGHSAVIR